jgi:hypothetical protein
MAAADLQGPLDDFLKRTSQIRTIVTAIESASSAPGALTTPRPGVDLSTIGVQTGNTVNAMSLVFLASSFEEFVRDEIIQCSGYLSERYQFRPDNIRHKVRNAYWDASLQRLGYRRSILNKATNVPDGAVISQLGGLLDSMQKFVVGDDSSPIYGFVFTHHSRNFKPDIVEEIAKRLGISNLLTRAADNPKVKTYFGVATRAAAAERLRAKLNDFFDRRNETVHSLSGVTGFAVNVILDYLDLFEVTAESIRNVLIQELRTW